MLQIAMSYIKDPSHSHIRKITGDDSTIDYYWYELVRKILAVKSKYEAADVAIDNAIAHALNNGKAQILCELLKHIPQHAPQTIETLDNNKKTSYLGDLIVENAIIPECSQYLNLLVTHGYPIERRHVQRTLMTPRNDELVDALVKSTTINLQTALHDAIDYRDVAAAKKFLQAIFARGSEPDSDNYRKIFQSNILELKALALAVTKSLSGKRALMNSWDVDKIVKENDLKTINYLVENNINLGEILAEVVRHLVFAKNNQVVIGTEWLDLLNVLSKSDLPAQALDAAAALTLVNSRTDILRYFLRQIEKIDEIPKELQKTRKAIKQNIGTPYMKNKYFGDALQLGSIELIRIYLEEGMPVTMQDILAVPSSLDNAAQIRELLKQVSLKK